MFDWLWSLGAKPTPVAAAPGAQPVPAPAKPVAPPVAPPPPAVPLVTAAQLMAITPYEKAAICAAIAGPMDREFRAAGIVTPLRIAHFVAQACHESDHFRTLYEYWGPTAAQKRYDTRTDLGNTPAADGDGYLYRGRGIFQLTGRYNYEKMGQRLGLDLVGKPDLAADPAISVKIAVIYWMDRRLNEYADRDDVKGITKLINGGYNGLDDRIKWLNVCKTIWRPAMHLPAGLSRVRVLASKLNIRAQPSLAAPIIGYYLKGDLALSNAAENGWLRVGNDPNRMLGWVSGDYVVPA